MNPDSLIRVCDDKSFKRRYCEIVLRNIVDNFEPTVKKNSLLFIPSSPKTCHARTLFLEDNISCKAYSSHFLTLPRILTRKWKLNIYATRQWIGEFKLLSYGIIFSHFCFNQTVYKEQQPSNRSSFYGRG